MYTDEEEKDRDFGGPDSVPEENAPDDENQDPGVDVIPDPEPEPEPERVTAQQRPDKPKRDPVKTKFNQVMRDRERAYETIHRLQEENEQLRKQREVAAQTAVKNYEDVISTRLEQAKRLKTEALESGDTEAIVQADEHFLSAKYDSEKLNDMKAQQEFAAQQQRDAPKPQAPQYDTQDIYAVNPEPYQEWLSENDWMVKDSPNYDPEMAYQMNLYTDQLNHRILQSGIPPQEVDPDEYLAIVNNHAAALETRRQAETARYQRIGQYAPQQEQQQYTPPQRRELNMRPARQPVSPVRGQRSGGNTADRPQLTKEQAETAAYFARAGVDLKSYAKSDRALRSDPNFAHHYNRGQ